MHAHLATSVAESARSHKPRGKEGWAFLALLALLWLVWDLSQRNLFKPGDDVGYWLGVAGGVMMLLLLLYPLRKHVRALHRMGRVRSWLWAHMLFGIGGPLLVLLHCGFRAGSLNATAALYSMVIVASSGVMGRFLYVRVNRGLVFERAALAERKTSIGVSEQEPPARIHSDFQRMPQVQQALQAFEQNALKSTDRAGSHWLRLILILPVRSWVSRIQVQRMARRQIKGVGVQRGWPSRKLRMRRRMVANQVAGFYTAVMRVALFAAWERLFALWHVAHIPFVFLLVIAGVVHVVAVHAY